MIEPDLTILRDGAIRLGISLDESHLAQFGCFLRLIQEHNERAGLTTVADDEGIQRRHFLEALAIISVLRETEQVDFSLVRSIIDIGSGAGLPGIPLKILFPHIRVTLVEATGKKVSFMETAIAELGLENTVAIHGRAESLAHEPEHRGAYDLVTARAVARLPALLEMTLPFTHVNGILALPKGSGVDAELEDALRAFKVLSGRLSAVVPLPESDNLRLVIVRKAGVTPRLYPRRPGMPTKQPL